MTNDVVVYAVFLDADNNCCADCYISSSVDRVTDETYRWSLFMNLDGKLRKAEGRVASASDCKGPSFFEPMVEARRDAFCRIVRFDASPAYIVLDKEKVKNGLIKKTITNLRTHSIEKIPCHEYLPNALTGNSSCCSDREIATFVTDFMKPTEWENQDYWRDHWSIATVSFDLNNDGLCDALVCTPDQQSSRRLGWLPVCRVAGGKLQIEYDLENTECICCHQDAFCIATISNEVRVLVGLDAYVEKYDARKRVWSKTGDVLIKTDSNGKLKTTILPDGVEGLIREPGFCRLEHVSPKWHVGYRLDVKHKNKTQELAEENPLRLECRAAKALPFRVGWFNGASSWFNLEDSKKGFAGVREALVGGRIKCIERRECMVCESDAVTAPSIESAPEPECILREVAKETTSSDKSGKKIIRHKVRDDEDVTGLSILYDMPTDEIRRRNKLKRDEDVRPGQMVELEVDQDFVDSCGD